jgi:hypothetical protein
MTIASYCAGRRIVPLAMLMALEFYSSAAIAQAGATVDARLRSAAQRIAALDSRRQMASATAATVDSLLSLYSDSVVYEHPGVGAIVRGKAALRAGMLSFLGASRAGAAEVPKVTVGPGVVILETAAHADPRSPATPVPPTRRAFRVLEFDHRGLVRRIIDYPW